MFLFVLQFICCKMVDLAQTNTWCTAPPISPKAVKAVVRAVFESETWEVGGKKWKHLNSFIFHEISDFWSKMTPSLSECLKAWKQIPVKDSKHSNRCYNLWILNVLSGTSSCTLVAQVLLKSPQLMSHPNCGIFVQSTMCSRWQTAYWRVIRGFEIVFQKQT